MIKYKYRFKTRCEFENEYGGENWKQSGRTGWTTSSGMDCLFGREIDIKYYNEFLDRTNRLNMGYGDRFVYDGWSINHKMIKEVKIGIDYNDKKVLVYD